MCCIFIFGREKDKKKEGALLILKHNAVKNNIKTRTMRYFGKPKNNSWFKVEMVAM